LDPATFLIGEDEGIPAYRGAQVGGEAAQAVGCVNIAGEEDEGPRIGLSEKGGLVGGQIWACGREDIRARHRLTGHHRDAGRILGEQHRAEAAGIGDICEAVDAEAVEGASAA